MLTQRERVPATPIPIFFATWLRTTRPTRLTVLPFPKENVINTIPANGWQKQGLTQLHGTESTRVTFF